MILFLLHSNRVFKVGPVFALLAPLPLLPVRNHHILTSGVLPTLLAGQSTPLEIS